MRPLFKRVVLSALLCQAVLLASSTAVGLLRTRHRRQATFAHDGPRTASVGADRITIYDYGEDVYTDMLAAIRSARQEVHFETFIWKNDHVGEAFKRALIEAADRGVEVCVIYDGFANLVVPDRFKEFPPRLHSLEYPAFSPGWRFYDPRRYGRDHHKILCVDQHVGFVGGYNVGALYARHWRDTHVRIDGPSSWHLRRAFVESWNGNRSTEQPSLQQTGSPDWDSRIRVYRNAPRERRFPIRDMYLQAINRARRHIRLSHAYFVPDRQIMDALLQAADRGVDVRVLVPRKSNHPVMDWLAHRFFTELLRHGARVLLYEEAMIHTKSATVDGQWSTIGTANIDRMSLMGNYEINVEFFDATLARHMEETFETDSRQATELTLDDWQHRSPFAKLLEASSAPLRPLL